MVYFYLAVFYLGLFYLLAVGLYYVVFRPEGEGIDPGVLKRHRRPLCAALLACGFGASGILLGRLLDYSWGMELVLAFGAGAGVALLSYFILSRVLPKAESETGSGSTS